MAKYAEKDELTFEELMDYLNSSNEDSRSDTHLTI
jgi:hypothetical protein